MPAIQFLVERGESGQTVAELLRKRYKLSWTKAKRLVEGGHIRVAGQTTRAPEQRVKSGNRFWIAAGVMEFKPVPGATKAPKTAPAIEKPKPSAKNKTARPQPKYDLDVVYSDDAIVVVNKPAQLTSTRSREDKEEFGAGQRFLPKSLEELLPAHLGTPNRKLHAVHRLDRDTTGLMVFARTKENSLKLEAQFRSKGVERRYIALTRGIPKPGKLESWLVPDRGDGRRGSGAADHADARRSVTHLILRDRLGDFAQVECKLDTGRTHQIRIHLGEAGTPVCGESVYDRAIGQQPHPDASGATRPMLHAYRLGFQHPETDEFVGWEVDPPNDYLDCLGRLKSGAELPGNSPIS